MAHDISAELLAVFDATGDVVAALQRRTVFVMPPFRGQGLGAEIVIRAFECGVLHPDTMNDGNCLTVAGRANRRSAHRIAVERAVRSGIEVAPEILADYEGSLPNRTTASPCPPSTPRI
jgi:GNAT superfamily N-acetyltransferase